MRIAVSILLVWFTMASAAPVQPAGDGEMPIKYSGCQTLTDQPVRWFSVMNLTSENQWFDVFIFEDGKLLKWERWIMEDGLGAAYGSMIMEEGREVKYSTLMLYSGCSENETRKRFQKAFPNVQIPTPVIG